MKQFKWNEKLLGHDFWNIELEKVDHKVLTDLELIVHPPLEYKLPYTVRALCRVVAELVKLEEARNAQSSNPPEDVL